MNEYHNSTISSGNELNERGLQFFNSGKYDEAINYFNKAIVRNPSVPAYFTNRAQCYLKLQRWESACHDCRNAIGLDSNYAEGYHFLGLALLELQRYDEAIKNILRGYFAAMEQNQVSFKNNDICKQVESAINKRRASQGKKPIVVVGFSTRSSQVNRNGERKEDRVVRLKFRKDGCLSKCGSIFSSADETYHV